MKSRWIWALVAVVVLAVIVGIPACLMGRKAVARSVLPKGRMPTMAVSNAVLRLERLYGKPREGLKMVRVDAHGITALKFREALLSVGGGAGSVTTVWMPGAEDWLIVCDAGKLRLAEVMDRISEDATADTLGGLFASYVGELSDVLPAFANLPPETFVTPANFVMREVKEPAWLDWAEVESDVRKVLRDQMRSAQVVRRMILKGDMFMREDKLPQAVATWSRAAKRHPEDSLLQERLEHLRTNAEVFYRLGRPGMAARCWQTVSQICPNDANAFFRFGLCAEKLGNKDVAEKAFARSRRLREAKAGKKQAPQAERRAGARGKGKSK